jgi:hypothetical protein
MSCRRLVYATYFVSPFPMVLDVSGLYISEITDSVMAKILQINELRVKSCK